MTIRRTSIFIGLGIFLLVSAGAAWADPVLTIPFTLAQTGNASSGIYDANGTLVRTLSRKVHLNAGAQQITWDYKDDFGNLVPAGDYSFRVLSNNVTYTWEGIIGNNSSAYWGWELWRQIHGMVDMAAVGHQWYIANGYTEQDALVFGIDPQNPRTVADITLPNPHFAVSTALDSDGTNLYVLQTGILYNTTSEQTFAYAVNIASHQIVNFPYGQNPNNPVSQWNPVSNSYQQAAVQPTTDAIDFRAWSSTSANANPPAGIAVQRQGHVLAISYPTLNQILLFDKRSAQPTGTISISSPARMAVDAQDNLYVISGKTVVRLTNVTATGASVDTSFDPSASLVSPLSIKVSSLDPLRVVVADGGASQQFKGFDLSGNLLWTLGQPGGTATSTDPSVTNDRFKFITALNVNSSPSAPFVLMPDGTFWFYDGGTSRLMHYAVVGTTPQFLEQILFLPTEYITQVTQNRPTQVFGSGYLEYQIDYSQPLDRGANGSWKLVKNWTNGLNPLYLPGVYQGFRTPTVLSNGRTYALVPRTDQKTEVVELPASGPLRPTGIIVSGYGPGISLYPNGDLRYYQTTSTNGGVNGTMTVYAMPLTGFDSQGNPQWGPAQVLACGTANLEDPFITGCISQDGCKFPTTDSGLVVSLGNGRAAYALPAGVADPFSMHLGGMKAGSSQCGWVWRASPGVLHDVPLDGLGSFDDLKPSIGLGLDGVQYGAAYASAVGHHVFYNYYGEFWDNGEANQYMHFYDDGLFIGQFGTPGNAYGPGFTGNSMSADFVRPSPTGPIYLYVNDESATGGINRWRIDNPDSVSETSTDLGPITPPGSGAPLFSITQQPVSQTVTVGSTATFTVGVNAPIGDVVNYQWLLNGVPLPGATQSSYITPTATSDLQIYSGRYSCLLWDVQGSTQTNTATVVLNLLPGVAFIPETYTVVPGATSTIVTVQLADNNTQVPNGPVTVDYATYDETALAGKDYQAVSGTLLFHPLPPYTKPNYNPGYTTLFITIPIMPKTAGGVFHLRLQNPVNTYFENMLTANVIIPPDPTQPVFQITQNPQSQQVTAGQSATFSIQTTPGFPANYQWFKNGLPIAQSNNATYSTPATTVGDNNAVLACSVSDGSMMIESASAMLTVSVSTGSGGGGTGGGTNGGGSGSGGGGGGVSVIAPRVYPSPWRASVNSALPITFDQLSPNATVKIFTVSGRWIKTLIAANGQVSWDLVNDSGQKVASGIYLYVITDEAGGKTTGKFVVIH